MLVNIARFSAFLLWLPGVGIPIADEAMLSPYELFILGLLPIIALTAFTRSRMIFAAIALSIFTASYVNSIDRAASTVYFGYYVVIMLPQMLLFLQIFEDDQASRAFLAMFVKVGVWLGPLAIIQFLSPVAITLNNNTNYALQSGNHRAQLFTPEASILAALYAIAIAMSVFNKRRMVIPEMPSDRLSLWSMAGGLAATVSTSAVTLLPPLLMFVFRISGVSWKTLFKYVAVGIVALLLFYFGVYQHRVESGDSTSSTIMRFASMAVGGQIVLQHWLTGLGLGMNKTVNDAFKLLYFQWSRRISDKPGIDSFQLSQMAEMGVIPGIISIAAFIFCYFILVRDNERISASAKMIAVFSVSVWFVSLLTSGYRGLAHCWLYFPASYALYGMRRAVGHETIVAHAALELKQS